MAVDTGVGTNGDRVSRLFDILELLVSHKDGMTVTEISKRLDLPISSTHNMLQRLVAADVVAVTAALRYSVGARLVRLGIRVSDGLELRALARKPLQDLARSIGDDVYLAVRLGRRVVYVDRVQGTRLVSVDIRLGQALFLHATSVGKLFSAHIEACRRELLAMERPKLTKYTIVEARKLLEQLDKILVDGYAVSDQEATLGIAGVAVPILDRGDALVAAIHVSALRAEMTSERTGAVVAAAQETAAAIERALGR